MQSFFSNIFTFSFIQTKPTEIDLNYTIPATDVIGKKSIKGTHTQAEFLHCLYKREL